MKKIVYLVANGDSCQSANQYAEAHQVAIEQQLSEILHKEGYKTKRAHSFDRTKQHGFIDSQHYGLEVFRSIPREAPVILVSTILQCSQHIISAVYDREINLLTFSLWDGMSQGLPAMLELNGALKRSSIKFNTLWTDDLHNPVFQSKLSLWLQSGKIKHSTPHTRQFRNKTIPKLTRKMGEEMARELKTDKAIMGIVNEGWKGGCQTIVPDHLLCASGIFKERLSHLTFHHEIDRVSEPEAKRVLLWLKKRGLPITLDTNGTNKKNGAAPIDYKEQTNGNGHYKQDTLFQQAKYYVAAVRLAHKYGCSSIGIQNRPHTPAQDQKIEFFESLLNNVDRPPVYRIGTRKELFSGQALPYFTQADEFAGFDSIVTNKVWNRLGFAPETWSYNIFWGLHIEDQETMTFVWILTCHGTPPPSHLQSNFAACYLDEKQKGKSVHLTCKAGWGVWSNIYFEDDRLRADLGLIQIPLLTKKQYQSMEALVPKDHSYMPAALPGITRDQMLARHRSRRVQIGYAPTREDATRALRVKGVALQKLGLKVTICGRF
ncbi:MAG: hypothetical protein AAGA18_14315 [Verrucomicrobiota bacterium]